MKFHWPVYCEETRLVEQIVIVQDSSRAEENITKKRRSNKPGAHKRPSIPR